MWYDAGLRKANLMLASRGFPETRPSLLRSLRCAEVGGGFPNGTDMKHEER